MSTFNVDLSSRLAFVRAKYANASGVAGKWYGQYFRAEKWFDEDKKAIHQKLLALGRTPSLSAVAEIIGNKSWSYLNCSGCGDYHEVLVAIGGDDEHLFCKQLLRSEINNRWVSLDNAVHVDSKKQTHRF